MTARATAALLVMLTTPLVEAQTSVARAVKPDLESRELIAAMAAHHLCSGMFVVGRGHERSMEEVLHDDIVRFPAFSWQDDFTYGVDLDERSATVTGPGFIAPRTALYNDDQGCTILPRGADHVFFEPVDVVSALPDASQQPWPLGDVDAYGDFPEVDAASLDAALDWAISQDDQHTRALVVVYRGKVIGERYADGFTKDTPQISWSQGKSITAALIGVLVQQGELTLDEPAPVAEWQGPEDPRREIRVRDLLNMSSGLEFANYGLARPDSWSAANEHFRVYFDSVNVFEHAVKQPLEIPPGSQFRYRNSDPLTLGRIVREKVEARGGDYGSAWDWARFGLLHLQDGVFAGEKVLPEGWVDFISTPAPGDPSNSYGGLFWVNRGGAMHRVPKDAFWPAGFMGQLTVIIPSRDMVVVRLGPSPAGASAYVNETIGRVLDAVSRTETPDRGR